MSTAQGCSFDCTTSSVVLHVQVLLLEHDINTSPFTPAVHACVPPLPWSVTQADVDDRNRCARPGQLQERARCQHHCFRRHCLSAQPPLTIEAVILAAKRLVHNIPLHCREDLRHLCVCSVDPPGCKDIDDALHVRSRCCIMYAAPDLYRV
jgi:exosome complex exonuclease DIS3/RRP44